VAICVACVAVDVAGVAVLEVAVGSVDIAAAAGDAASIVVGCLRRAIAPAEAAAITSNINAMKVAFDVPLLIA